MDKSEKKYTKLSALVDNTFTVEKAYGFDWKKWDEGTKRFILSDTYQEGFRKVYGVETDKGKLDLGSGQLSSLLEAVYSKGVADINGKTFGVKSNGKSGLDVRYFFKVVRDAPTQPTKDVVIDNFDEDEQIDLNQIPF